MKERICKLNAVLVQYLTETGSISYIFIKEAWEIDYIDASRCMEGLFLGPWTSWTYLVKKLLKAILFITCLW